MTFRAVGLGASAGGLEAVSELFSALPAGTGMAWIVVQHLDPRHESLLPELLQKKSTVPVTAAVDGEVVHTEHVYVIPPNTTLTVADGRFHLTERPAFERHLPVDALFQSLAIEYSENAIAVVLSGGDSDGSLGIQAVKQEGGIVFAQRPESARFPNMPQHAIDTGCVDMVLSPTEIAHRLQRLSRHRSRSANDPRSQMATTPEAVADGDEALLKRIFRALRAAHGLDFTHYKRSTVWRRLRRRMALRGIESLEEYCAVVDAEPAEMAALQQDFLIRVTEFFRDPDTDEALQRRVFPALHAGRVAKQPIRIWVPGCATGEEVYSVAIHLLESVGERLSSAEAQIFGTDVSEAALEKARAGIYLPSVMRGVSDERLQRFFEKQADGFRIRKEIRDMCIFARQDVTRDPPFSRLDLISCRNLLIYLDDVAQRRVFQAFHFALRPHGLLLIGAAESVGQSTELFEQVDKGFRVYRRRPGSGLGAAASRAPGLDSVAFDPAGGRPSRADAESLPREADRWLLARYAPASLLVDEALNVHQFRGRTGPFLEPASGAPSVDLRRLARPELLVELLPAIREARETGLPTRRDDLRLDDERNFSVEVVPLAGPSGAQSFLILLDDGSHPHKVGHPQTSSTSALPESEKDRRLAQLQHEIETLRDYLRTTIEEHGSVQEELKSAQEEMLSANEEYQSTNEELESAKEELQSANEELSTTIEELRNRNRDLGALNADVEHARFASEAARAYADTIIETVRFPLAVIDSERRIKRMNRAFAEDLEISPETAESVLNDDASSSPWNVPALREKLQLVIREGRPMDDFEVALNLPQRGRRVLVLNARRIPADGGRDHLVLLAADDVTDRVRVADDLLLNGQRKDEFLAMLAHELRHPLTPISHAIHLLRRAEVEPATAALYETIDTETRRLERFVNDLLDVVRVDRGLLNITRGHLDLVDVVQRGAAAVQPLIELHNHVLKLVLGQGPILIDGDAGRLGQVVSNLLENAAKYTEPGGEIVLTVVRDGDEAVLSVRDNGIGIAASDVARIFEPFTQTDSARSRGGGGLGLGLSVARRVVSLHGGRIEARSAGLGQGSDFTVRLPTARVSERARSHPSTVAEASSADARSAARKVLIVDDREEVTSSLVRLLGAFGHETAVAHDAASGLERATAFGPDCAIVDLGLPDVSGFELARRLRAVFPADKLLLIAFTGSGGPRIDDECRAAGFDTCVIKPGNAGVLEKLLQAGPRG